MAATDGQPAPSVEQSTRLVYTLSDEQFRYLIRTLIWTLLGVGAVMAVLIIGAYAHGVYVDWASCERHNEAAQGDRGVAAIEREQARIVLKAAALGGPLAPERGRIAANDLRLARLLDEKNLSCSLPAPQVR